eukprot:3929640-Rhodomonas_salina.3
MVCTTAPGMSVPAAGSSSRAYGWYRTVLASAYLSTPIGEQQEKNSEKIWAKVPNLEGKSPKFGGKKGNIPLVKEESARGFHRV